ncbi:MAG: ABC transporter substrate-binding protein, partial [Enterobacterales bacterium]|nr:ABC transporter substrate-binding protein [Enterobacterales bacterium]
MRGLKTLMLALSCLSAVATAAEIAPVTKTKPLPDIRQSGFIYCVSGILNTFNPQMASSGLTVDTLAAQLYDRLLDVDPYTYRLIPELAQSWEVLDGGAPYVLHLRKDVPFQTTDWVKPTRKM